MGVIAPEPGFNEFLARTCAEHGALFVSDEVMTGFRASRTGQWGLDGAVEGWRPDLMTFGKVMGGGFPAAAFGGRADVMARLAPEGPVYQAGTLSGNPVAATAGLTTLRLADDGVYEHLTKAGETIKTAAHEALSAAGVPHVRPVDRHHVLRVLHRPAGPRLRRRLPPGHRGVRGVLPRDARPRRPPAAVGVRGLVPVRRPRRPRASRRSLDALPAAARAAAEAVACE